MFHFNVPLNNTKKDFNLHLLYYKYAPYLKKYKDSGVLATNVCRIQGNYPNQEDKEAFLNLIVKRYEKFSNDSLETKIKKLKEYVKAGGGYFLVLRNESRFLCGIGYQSPLEWGFQFDWTTGIPYLPGSSFKGALLGYLEFINDKPVECWKDGEKIILENGDEWTKEDIYNTFGPQGDDSEKSVGNVIFLDVYPDPEHFVGFDIDVITPHYKPYYEKGLPPADIYNPEPIYFLTLKPGSRFLFMFKFRSFNSSKGEMKKILRLIEETASNFGFGAKTASGYGYFKKFQN